MEGPGEGMVAIVQALQDAGLTVTLTNATNERTENARRSDAYKGMSKALRWTGQASRVTNSQNDSFRRYHAGCHNGIIDSYQMAHSSKSTGSPLPRSMDASPHRSKHHFNEHGFHLDGPRYDVVTQTPVAEALSSRSSAHWSQRAIQCPSRSSRGTDAFADSLRKYPATSISPERSPSADIIQRLLNYTQNKNSTRCSYQSKSLRSLRHMEPCKETIKKSAKNTYMRAMPTRETSPYNNEMSLRERNKSLHSHRSDNIKYIENPHSCKYDYLKETSPNFSPPRGTDVRYLQDVTKYVRDTLKQMCDENPTTCPKIASRYSQHKKQCPRKTMRQSSSVSVHVEVQTSPPASREVSLGTSPPRDCDDKTFLVPKICGTCQRPLPCLCRKSSSTRKIRFSIVDQCPRFIVKEVTPTPECTENVPCSCPEPDKFKKKLEEQIQAWLKEIPVSATFSLADKIKREKAIKDLVDKLIKLRGTYDYEDMMRKDVLECLDNLPMWFPSSKCDKDVFKNELVDDLIINRLRDLFKKRNKFDETIAKWVDHLNFDTDIEPVNKETITQDFINILNPLNQYRIDDNELYEADLKDNILDMLQKLPLNIEGNKNKYHNDKANQLAKALTALPKMDVEEKDLLKKQIHDRLKEIPEAKDLKPSIIKNEVERLSGKVKDMFQHDINDDERQDIMRSVVDDWVESTLKEPHDEFISDLIKIISEFLDEIPELCGNTSTTKKENANISKRLAKKTKYLLPEVLEDDDVMDALLEEINDTLNDTLNKRGEPKNPKTTKKLAVDLLNKVMNAVKQSKKLGSERLKNDLRKKILDWIDDQPELAGDSPSFKKDNFKMSNELSKKVVDLLPDLLEDKKVKEQLSEDIIDQLNVTWEKRGEHKDLKTTKRLANHLLNKLVDAIRTPKTTSDYLENYLRKIVLDELEKTVLLTGDSPSNKYDNDKLSNYLAKKLLEVPPEYLDKEEVKENLLEDINDQLKNAFIKRGHRKDPKSIEMLAENMFEHLKNAIIKERGLNDSTKDPLENTLRKKIIECLDDIQELAGDSSITKRDNEKISTALAKKMLEVPPEHLVNDDIRDKLIEKIYDQLEDALQKRGHCKDAKSIEKLAENLFDNLKNAIIDAKEMNNSNTEPLKNTLRKEIIERGQHLDRNDTKANRKGSASASSDNLENELRNKVLEYLEDSLELSGDTLSNKRENDKISKDIARKVKDFLPDLLEDDNLKERLIDEINETLKDTLEKRGKHMDPKGTKKFAENMFNKLVSACIKEKKIREKPQIDLDALKNDVKNKILDWLEDIPEHAGNSPSIRKENEKFCENLARKVCELSSGILEDKDMRKQLLDEINNRLNNISQKRGLLYDPKVTNQQAEDLIDILLNCVKKAKKKRQPEPVDDSLQNNLIKKTLDWMDNIPEITGDSPSNIKYNENFSKDIAMKISRLPRETLDDKDVLDNLEKDIKGQLKAAFKKRGYNLDPKTTEELAKDLVNTLTKEVSEFFQNDQGEKKLLKTGLCIDSGNMASSSAGSTDLRNTVWKWYKEIPELSVGDIAENKKVVNKFADQLQRLKNEGGSDKQMQNTIDNWLKETSENKGVKLNKKEKDKLIYKLLDAIESNPKPTHNYNESEEIYQNVWNWFNNIPEISFGDPIANKESTDTLTDMLQKLIDEGGDKQEIHDTIDEWLLNTSKKKRVHLSTSEKKIMRDNLMDSLKYVLKPTSSFDGDDETKRIIWTCFKDIPVLSGGDEAKNTELVDKLAETLKTYQKSDDMSEKNEQTLMDEMEDWFEETSNKKGVKLKQKEKERLKDKLAEVFKSYPIRKFVNINHSIDYIEEPTTSVWRWFKNIPEISGGDTLENMAMVVELDDKLQKLKNQINEVHGEEEIEDAIEEIEDAIQMWLEDVAEKKGVKMSSKKRRQLRKNLMDTLQPKRTSKQKIILYSDDESGGDSQKIWEWFTDIPEISYGDPTQNQKLVNQLHDKLKKIQGQNLDHELFKHKIQGVIDNWLHDVASIKGEKLNTRIKEVLRNNLMNSLELSKRKKSHGEASTSHADDDFKQKTNSGICENTNSKSYESDDTDKIISSKNKLKSSATEIFIDKLKAYKSALRGFKNASVAVDVDRQTVSQWLHDIPEIKFDDKTESEKLVDRFATKLKTLRKEGKVNNEEHMREEVENWLEEICQKKGRKLDERIKKNVVNELVDSLKTKPSKIRKGNTTSDQSIDGSLKKGKLRANSTSPEEEITSQSIYYSYKGPKNSNDFERNKLKKNMKEIQTSTESYDNESSQSYNKDRKRWNKEQGIRSYYYSNEYETPNRTTGSPKRKYEIDTILSDDGDAASIVSQRIPTKSPSSATRGKQTENKSKRPTPENILRQEIIGGGFETEIMSKSNNQPNEKPKKMSTIERQKSFQLPPKKLSSYKKSGKRHSSGPLLTPSEVLIRKILGLRTRSDAESKNLIKKSNKPKHGKKKLANDSNKSLEGSSESNGPQTRRKSVATQQPIQKDNKKSGEGKVRIKISKQTKAKVSAVIAKNIDTVISPDHADIEENIMDIFIGDLGLPYKEARALAKTIIRRVRSDHGFNDDDPEETEFDLDSDDESSDESSKTMNPARKLVRDILDESSYFNLNSKHQMQVENAIVDLIAGQLSQGDIDDTTRDEILELLQNKSVPDYVADDICDNIMRRAREKPLSIREYPPPPSARNTLVYTALTPTQKQTFLKNAQQEIGDFYEKLCSPVGSASRQNVIDDATKDTVTKLAEILDDSELTGQQKKDMMRNELIRYLRNIPKKSNMTEEELADQLMDKVGKNVKFTSSTPEHSQVEVFNPKMDNLDPSYSSIFEEKELEANETLFYKQIIDAIQSWSEKNDAIKNNVGFIGTMVKDLANEIIDRQKYLQVNPDVKTSDEDELEHLKYIVFRWLNKMADLKDLADTGTLIDNLVGATNAIPVPKMVEPSSKRSLWALSRTSQGFLLLYYSDPLELDVLEWLQHIPSNIHMTNDPEQQERQIKQFVDTIRRHKEKSNVEELVEKETNQWLPIILKPVEQPLLDTFGNDLKLITKNKGYINPVQRKPVEPVMSPNENQMPQHQQPNVPIAQTNTMASQNTGMQPQPGIQSQQASIQPQSEMSRQQPEILQQSGIQSEQPGMQPQSCRFIPTDYITSTVTDWVNKIPTYANNPEEQQNVDKMRQNLILQIKMIRQQHPTTSNEYETKHREPIKFFLENIHLEPEKKQDDQYITDKTNELLKNLGVSPTNTVYEDKGSPRFKKASDVLYDVVQKWCKDLPIYGENPTEDPEKINALKQNVASKLIYKIGELNLNPEILNDDFLYEDLLLDDVDKLLKDVPKNPELDKYLPALKMELAAKVKNARQKIRDELAGQAYKQQLRDTIITSICLSDNLPPDEQASFEILRDNLADAFINLHYVPDNDEEARKIKMKINDEINRFCNEFLRRHPKLPIDRRKLAQDLYAALLGVPIPRDESMIHEVEQARIKNLINDWMKELPLIEETLTEQLQRNKMASILAKRLHDVEREKALNPDLENEMFEEIAKWLRKQQLRPGQEVYIPELADRLKNKLKSTEYSRRFDSPVGPPHTTESKPGLFCIGRMPPCTLSKEDRVHLQKIRHRQKSPCSRDAIVCPDTGSYSQSRARSPCSRDAMVCPRMNSYSQTEVRPKFSERSSWCRKEFCPGKTQTPAQMSGSYCSTSPNRDVSCMTSTQSPYEVSPHVIVKKYYWDTTNGSNQPASFKQTQTPVQQLQDSHASAYQTPQQSYQTPQPNYQTPQQSYETPQQNYQTPQPGYQTPRQSFPQSPPNYVPPPHYMTPQASTSNAYRQNPCECHPPPPTDEEIPFIPIPNPSNVRFSHCYRTPDASSGEEDYPETSRSFRRVRVTRLGSLDDMSCRNRRPAEKKSRIPDDESEWSSVRFTGDGEFWDCPRHRIYGAPGFIHEREKKQEKVKCKCKERVLSTCRRGNGRSYREFDTRHCRIHCPHPSYIYFRR